jgi:hypothetical protein
MKTRVRFGLGILLGAIGGAVIAHVCLELPTVRQTVGIYAFDFEIAFGRSISENLLLVLTLLGTFAGAAVGASLAVSIRWFAVLWTLLAGIAIGGLTMFFVEVKNANYASRMWEQNNADQSVFYFVQALKAIERGRTNRFYLAQFQHDARTALTNYVNHMENQNGSTYPYLSGTNAPAYGMARKYLATHTNSLPIGSDF